jgi:transcription-repair coupling factor (superfamily II helicase)
MPDKLSEPFDRAAQFLAKSVENGGVYGLSGSAREFLIAAAVRKEASTIVVVLPDGEAAARCATDVRFYMGAEKLAGHMLLDDVLHYPSSDALPYSFSGFERDVGIGRMASLCRLTESRPPRVLALGLDALITKILPRDCVAYNSFGLTPGQDLDRELLLKRLIEAGYVRSPLVEDVGDFSIRGFIIDLYSPLYPFPVRIEQMGDRIESIRFFDPATQRSRDDLSEILVGPVHMIIPDADARESGLERIVTRCEERGVEKRVRQRIIEDFRNKIRFPGAEFYLTFFFPDAQSLLDYFPSHWTLALPDQATLARAFEDLGEEIFRGWQSAVEAGLPVPSPDELYLGKDDFAAGVKKFRTVIISSLEIDQPERTSHRLSCRSNSDVREKLLRAEGYDSGMAGLVKRLEGWRDDGVEVFLVSHTRGQANRLLRLLEPYEINIDYRAEDFDPSNLVSTPTPGVRLYVGELSCGFRMKQAYRVVLTEEEIFGSRVRSAPARRARGAVLSTLTDLCEGDAVVHEDYGIGIFRGLVKKEFDGVPGEVMIIEYAGQDLLYHPVQRLESIQKYVSGSEGPPRVDRLGGKGWITAKARVKSSLREMARELLVIHAERAVATRQRYSPPDENFAAFEASFEFEETQDQAAAISEVMAALDSDRPMDLLVCGDVGYGKTEVALRAAFRVVMDGKQAAFLVPTTVLAQQHYETVCRRFRAYPFAVDVLSRFRTAKEQKDILERLSQGKLDLIVGTHRLLQKDVAFADLGLLVVDEEHRFGVAHKERIKKFRAHVDVLTLTATPIPRTLNMSLTGIRDLSVIESPPPNRKSIRTRVAPQSDEVIQAALRSEITRGGQAFYLHNRVRSIYRRAGALQQLVPEGRFVVAHGQMDAKELEQVMFDFVNGKYNVLVCTSIIESGLDIPRANTIIIERADAFGLADLYQLRGRVGRSNVRAYAYLLTPPEAVMTPDAIKRLAVIQEHSDLGQGFRIAMRDMEIRGAGNLLGASQSGHVAQVGYEMYLSLLEEAVKEIKGEQPPPRIDPEIRLQLEAHIPEEYVPDPQQRMNLYKRLSRATDISEIEGIEDEIIDLYGKPPLQTSFFLRFMHIRAQMKRIGVRKIDYAEPDLVLTFDPSTLVRSEFLVAWAQKEPGLIRLLPDDRVLFRVGRLEEGARIDRCHKLLELLGESVRVDSAPQAAARTP